MRLLLLALVLCVGGCQTPNEDTTAKTLAAVSFWSTPPEPIVTYEIKDDGFLYLAKTVRIKRSNFVFPITKEQSDACLALAKAAHEEVMQTQKMTNVFGGVNIRIVIDGDTQSAATIRNYGQSLYNLKHVPLLFTKLNEVAPENRWR
jgi:hypothetical protein